MGSLERSSHPAIATNLATMEDLSEFEDDGEEDDGRSKMPLPTMAELELSPVVHLQNDEEYEEPTYRRRPGLKRYHPTFRAFLPSKIPQREQDVLPIDRVGFCSNVMYSWMTSFLWSVYRHGASAMKVYRCTIMESCSLNSQRLEYLWNEEVKRNGPKASLSAAISRFIRTRMYISAFTFTLGLVFGFFTPVMIVYNLMEFVNDEDAPLVDGLVYPLLVLVVDGVRMFIFSYQWALNIRTALRLRTAVLGLVFKKLVHLNTLGNKSVGEIINLFANDSARVLEYAMLGHLWIGGTIAIFLSLGYVFWILGLPAFACVGVFVSFYATMFGTSKLIGFYRRKAVKASDQRVRQMTEILNCMKIIKLYAWEEPFMKKTTEIRNRERSYLEKLVFLQSFGNSASHAVPIVAAIATFMTCFALGYSLSAAKVFSILGALIMTRVGLMILPVTAGKVAEFRSAIARLQSVLELEDMPMVASTPKDTNHAVVFKDASFAWNSLIPDSRTKSEKSEENGKKLKQKKKNSRPAKSANCQSEKPDEHKTLMADVKDGVKIPSLHDINLIVTKGQLIGICGTVGSGKSSLISAILGQMHLLTGDLAIRGSCAYVAQQAWIMNETVANNIAFGADLDAERLSQVVRCCGLLEDVQALPGGLEAEIGERGINLSGGQKQRISIARAAYSERDVYLMDDPLSAVDYRVGAHIFQNCFRGALKSKTVLFVSHQIHYLEQCDYVVVMKDGRIVEQGSPLILQKNDGTYADLLQLLRSQQQEATHDAKKHKTEGAPDATIPGSPKSDRGDDKNDAGARITTDEVKEHGTISFDTYLSYIRAMGGALVALAIVLVIGANYFATVFSNWWLSEMLTKSQATSPGNVSVAGNFSSDVGNSSSAGNFTSVDDSELVFVGSDLFVYGCMIGAILLSCLLRAWIYVKGTLRAATVLHKEVLSKVIQSPMRFFETVPIGRTINIFSKDLDEVDMALTNVLELFLSLAWANVTTVLIIAIVFPWFLIPLAIILVLFVFFTAIFQAGLREVKRCENSSRSPLFGHINAMLQGLATIHAYGKEDDFYRRFLRLQDENTVLHNIFLFSTRWVALRLDLLVVAIMVATATFVVFSRGVIPAAFAGLSLSYSAHLGGMLQFLVRNMAETQARFTNVERIVRNIKTLVREGAERVASATPPAEWPLAGDITFSDVELRYREGLPPALDGISFRVRAGEKVGIVGRTGSGKSTLGTALFRLVELSRGAITIDGLDISTVALHTLRSRLSLIPQDPVLFIGTIRYNLDPFGQCTDEDVWQALERTRLKEKVSSLDKQLYAPVVENGENFSVGERQLICLARALLRGSKIILLDEATASVDARTDALVQDILQEAFGKCTILTIAHRVHTVLNYDRILVLRKGKIQLFDDPQTLRADPKSYLSLLLKESLDKCKPQA